MEVINSVLSRCIIIHNFSCGSNWLSLPKPWTNYHMAENFFFRIKQLLSQHFWSLTDKLLKNINSVVKQM